MKRCHTVFATHRKAREESLADMMLALHDMEAGEDKEDENERER